MKDKRSRFYRHNDKGLHTEKCRVFFPDIMMIFCKVTFKGGYLPFEQTLDTAEWASRRQA